MKAFSLSWSIQPGIPIIPDTNELRQSGKRFIEHSMFAESTRSLKRLTDVRVRGVLSMVKTILFKTEFSRASKNRLELGWNRLYNQQWGRDCGPHWSDWFTCWLIKLIKKMSQWPKDSLIQQHCCWIYRVRIVTMGSPKGFYTYGDRVTIVADFSRYGRSNVLRRRRVTVNPIRYSTGSANTVMNKMESLNQFSKTNPGIQIDRKLFNLLCNPDILYRAYQNIKSKPGYMIYLMTFL
jgi:hypothetical protein